jgi:DNA polymerase-3 subunit delta
VTAPKPLDPVYLIVGNDRPKVRRALQRLRDRAVKESGSDINVTSVAVEGGAQAAEAVRAVLDAAATPGLALGARVIIVTGVHHLRAGERKQLVAYIQDPTPETTLALEADKLAKDDALYKAEQKRGQVLVYELPRKYEMAGWLRKMAQGKGLVLGPAPAKHLLDLCGEDPSRAERLEREVEKLAAYCRGRDATVQDVAEVCVPDDEVRIFDLMDAVGHRRREQAFALLEAVFASGDPRDDANAVLYSLRRHIGLLDKALRLGHDDQSTAAKQLGVHPFTARKLLEQRAFYDRRRLDRAFRALAVAETGLRGKAPATLETVAGVNNSDRLVLELALARLLQDPEHGAARGPRSD